MASDKHQNDAKPAPTPAFPPEVTAQIDELTKLHAEYEAARKAMSAERRALESKYQTLYSDIYKKRSVVISGESAKAVPDFWLTAFKNNRVIADFVEPHDEDAIKALLDVQVEYLDNFAGFKLSFIFAENEWFEDRVLTKSIYIDDILEATDPAINKLEGSEIHWKAGKDLTVKSVKKTVKKGGNRKRTVVKTEPVPSFFRFFETPDTEAPDSPEEAQALYEQIEAETDVAMELRNKVVPNALNWYTGVAAAEEEDMYGDDDDDEEEEEGDDDDDNDAESGLKRGAHGGKNGEGDDDDDDDDDADEQEEGSSPPRRRAGNKQSLTSGGDGAVALGSEGATEGDTALAAAFTKGVAITNAEGAASGANPTDQTPECKQQ